VDYSKSFFPVILIVFVLRSFLVEPFKIPSGSMLPTLLIGDFILVNKFDLRHPPAHSQQEGHRTSASRSAAMSWCFAIPRGPVAGLHQAGGRPARAIPSPTDKRLSINGKPVAVEVRRRVTTMSAMA
jgi:signal peptidase I